MRNGLRILTFIITALTVVSATTVRPMPLDKLTSEASVVVEGRAVETWSDWNPQHTAIYTYTRITVSRSLKGGQPRTLLVKQPGGVKDGLKEVVFGVHHLQPGEDAVLFLTPSLEDDGTHVIVGLMQGQFRVYRSASGVVHVSNGMPEVIAVDTSGRTAAFTGSHMTLQQLESRVQAVTK